MADPYGEERETHRLATTAALAAVYAEVRADVMARVLATGDSINVLRAAWREAVQAVATRSIKAAAADVGGKVSDQFDPATVEHYLDATGSNFADRWHERTSESLDEVSAEIDATFDQVQAEIQERVDRMVAAANNDATELVTTSTNLAQMEAAVLEGHTTKTWNTSSDDPRTSHAALNGVTVPMDDRFPNGLRFPGSPGPPQEVINCKCNLTTGG